MTMSKGRPFSRWIALAIIMIAACTGGAAYAGLGQPSPWEIKLQDSATPVMDNIIWFHNFLLWLITGITLFVLALLVIVVVRFNAKSNPVPSRTTHHTLIEVAWTIIPVLILVGIAVPSFRLLFQQLDVPKADLTIKVTGAQWNWNISYPDDKIDFTAIMLTDAERAKMDPVPPRLLAVDNEVVVPVDKVVRVQTTSNDVIHSFAVPSFGIKIDAIPGRLNETWFKATKEGKYYGQCSELCGKDHAFMPVVIRVVKDEEFAAWKQQQAALLGNNRLASTAAGAR
uniref:Cytochrome c oxidase subunit 2 n=1 Tax=Rhodopseudomonas palustris (strain BisA53) TaxID=316055 RepID=Q07HB4_RHOP5